MSEAVIICGLELWARVGVPEAERAHPQRLELHAEILPLTPFAELGDDIARTVDYDLACRRLCEWAAARPRRLIETLALELAQALVAEFPARAATIEIRKFILPRTAYVAARASAQASR